MPVDPKNILDNPDDIEYLKSFIEMSDTATTATMNMTRVASEIHLAKTLKDTGDDLEVVINRMTESLENALANHAEALNESARASDRHSSSLKWATWALVLATIGLAIIAGLQLWLVQ